MSHRLGVGVTKSVALRVVSSIWVLLAAAVVAPVPASAIALYQGTITTLQVGNLLIESVACTATGNASCATTTWAIDANSLGSAGPGSFAITISPANSTVWNHSVTSDLNVTFWVLSLDGTNTPNASLHYVNGIGGTVNGSGILADGMTASNAAGSLGATLNPTANTDPSSPTNRLSFSPQSVVYINADIQPIGPTGSTITSANIYVNRVPEPATFGLLALGGIALAALRRRHASLA